VLPFALLFLCIDFSSLLSHLYFMHPELIESNLEAIRCLCVRHKVLRLDVFGSILRPDFNSESDVDLLVLFERGEAVNAFEQYFSFKESLESLLGRSVDLVCANAIRNPVFKLEVEGSSQQLYVA
jgi:predicted nucleotidyltransferase